MTRLALALWLALTCVGVGVGADIGRAGEAIIDARSGRLIAGADADQPRFPASTTKLMTIFVALEAAARGDVDLDAKVRISRHAAAAPPVKLGLREGEAIRLSQAIHAALILSSNDAARVIAEAVAGSEARFARQMTDAARALGMRDTVFRNASGLPDAGHVSTAADIGRLILRLDQRHGAYLRPLFRAPLIWRGGSRRPRNGTVASVTGARLGKTGFTCAAGYTAAVLIETEQGPQAIATMANSGPGPRAASLRRLAQGRAAAHAFVPPCLGSKPARPRKKPPLAAIGDWSLTLGVFPDKEKAVARLKESRLIAPNAARIVATRRARQGFYAIVLAEDRIQAFRLKQVLTVGGVAARIIDRFGRRALGLEAHSAL